MKYKTTARYIYALSIGTPRHEQLIKEKEIHMHPLFKLQSIIPLYLIVNIILPITINLRIAILNKTKNVYVSVTVAQSFFLDLDNYERPLSPNIILVS